MHCYYHPRRPAVAQCQDCGKGLCRRCAAKYKVPICPECNFERKKNVRKTYVKSLAICAAFFVIGYAVGAGTKESPLLIGYLFMSFYGGWFLLGRLFSDLLIVLTLPTIVVYYILKVIFSVIIGVVATPIYIGYWIYKLVKLSKK